MKPDVVVDVGNSRIKWGRCLEDRVAESVSLPPDDPEAWQKQLAVWNLTNPAKSSLWAVSGVQPERQERLTVWLERQGGRVVSLNFWQRLSLRILVDPDRVGIDRLLNAVAARSRLRRRTPAVVIDAGSAVTVDWVDEDGAFGGGAIFPGLRLMAQALHEHTALLPLVTIERANPRLPGMSTTTAIEAGVFWAVVGGIQALTEQLASRAAVTPEVFLTGGDAPVLHTGLHGDFQMWPNMTLEGIRLAAEALP
jgi:type III pantothenate kinase